MRKYLIATLLAVAAGVVVSGSVFATTIAPFQLGCTGLFRGMDASAQWVDNHRTVQLNETPTGGAYAGEALKCAGSAIPATAPSFQEVSNVSSGSGGSPRLVMQLSDGGSIYLYNQDMTQYWAPATSWDSTGGSAGYLYNTTYQNAVADHSGATVQGVYLVTDSGWLNGGMYYTNWVTQLVYGGRYYTNER